MSKRMSGIHHRWDNGALQPWEPYGAAGAYRRLEEFIHKTGAQRAVELVWQCEGREHRVPVACDVLPDCSGVVLKDDWHSRAHPPGTPAPWPKHLRVINADGSLRFLFHAPVAEGVDPLDTWVEPPKYFQQVPGIFAVHVFDGAQERLLEIDWDTGRIVRDLPTGNWLWM